MRKKAPLRTSPRKKAKQLVKYIKQEQPNYDYLRELFRFIRKELDLKPTTKPQRLPYVPTEGEIKKYYEAVWQSKNMKHMMLIKTLIYTGMRASEVIWVKLDDVDINACQIRIEHGKKPRMVPFPVSFKETLAIHCKKCRESGATYLFESSWEKRYSDRGIRAILSDYTKRAGITRSISPHKLRHFLFTWLKKQGIDDALIQIYSGHDHLKSLEIYSKPSMVNAQKEYEKAIGTFPI
ncbi:MAG: site-specific integrase [Candidatus Pacebacteria bacterium]|jgi:integrase/recombinase XerD|nr:site-specific integrase [Candidatus Paceibacterota bacterium]